MHTDQQEPLESSPSRAHHRGFFRRLRHWWRDSSWETFRWRLSNWFFNWWFPTGHQEGDPGYGDYYGHHQRSRLSRAWRHLRSRLRHSLFSRWFVLAVDGIYNWLYPPREHSDQGGYHYGPSRHSRLGSALRRFRHWARSTFLGRGFAVLFQRFSDWWYPLAPDSQSYSGYYGRKRKNRLVMAWFAFKRALRHSWLGRLYAALTFRLYDWYYPVTAETGSYSGYYGRKRRSRLTLVSQWIKRTLRHSWLGRQCLKLANALYEWWYPVAQESTHSYSGYYGPRRRSRPELLWHALKRRLRNSWVGRQYALYSRRLYDWWYPPVSGSDFKYPHYQVRRVSRPVLAYRRWNRWFRKTWVGREFGWLLDEFFDIVFFVQIRLVHDLAWRRVQRFLLRPTTILAIGILSVGLILANKYVRPKYHQMLEMQYARQADLFLQKGDYLRAFLRARQALELNQDNPLAVRVKADIADWANDPYAIYWRQRTVLLAPTATNRIALANTALRMEQFPFTITTHALEAVDPTAQETPAFHLAAGALSLKLGKLQEAELHYRTANKLRPDDPVVRMSLAVVQMQSKDSRIVQDSRVTLELLNANGKLGILPLRSLVAESVNRGEFDRAEQLSSQVLTSPEVAFGDYMLHLAILHAAHRTNFPGFLKATQEKSLQHPVYIGELVSWMGMHSLAGDALAWTTNLPKQVSSQGLVPLAMADCFVSLKLWPELEAFLKGAHWVGMDHVRIAMLTYAIRNQTPGARTTYSDAWRRAIELATDAPTALRTLANIAWGWGWKDETEQVLWHAATKFPKQAWPTDSLKNLYATQKQTAGLHRLFDAMAKRDPADKMARNNYAMVSLLLRKDLPQAHVYAAELYQAEPTNSAYASTYAFSLYLQGKTRDGLEVLKKLKPEELDTPSLAVYHGILLSALGEKSAAKACLAQADKAFLLPEELALVETARKNL